MFEIGTPTGIGDISWMWSKLKHTGVKKFQIADGWPYRAREFVAEFEEIESVDDVQYNRNIRYDDILMFEQANGINLPGQTWEDMIKKFGEDGIMWIQCNRHLEMGKPLADWLPDLPVDFHYNFKPASQRTLDQVDRLFKPVADCKKPLVGINAASYRGSEAWKTWGYDEWKDFLLMLSAEGLQPVMLGGFWDDLTSDLASGEGYPDLIGKSSAAAAIEMQRRLDYYIGFSSGLGMIRTVIKKPVFMMWPDHQLALSTSWAPPELLEDRTYMCSLWREPTQVFKRVKGWLSISFKTE